MNDETNKNIKLSKRIFSINEARVVAQKKLPKLIFDFVDGASGDEKLSEINYTALDQVRLEPKVLRNVEKRKLNKTFFNTDYDYPFGFAPMGMCNLTWPGADKMLANASIRYNVPTCVSMASTTSLEKMRLSWATSRDIATHTLPLMQTVLLLLMLWIIT